MCRGSRQETVAPQGGGLTVSKASIPRLAEYRKFEDLFGGSGSCWEFTKSLVERALQAEVAKPHRTPTFPADRLLSNRMALSGLVIGGVQQQTL